MKKKKQKASAPRRMRCPYCGAPVSIRQASEIYHDPTSDKELYVCNNYPKCDTYVGMHEGTRIPFGTLANGNLRSLRIRAHRKFDLVWKTGIMSREDAYRWLADMFCLGLGDAHIGMFGEYRCSRLIEECDQILERHKRVG
jgi:hypothetical protein